MQCLVDELLMEQGGYDPVALLVAAGWLAYPDYEVWRAAHGCYLEDEVRGDDARLRAMLGQAARYVQALGLQPQPCEYFGWDGSDCSPQRCARDLELNALLRTRYARPETAAQLDLFMDSGGTALANAVTRALARRDPSAARSALHRLRHADPQYPRLGPLEQLVESALGLDAPVPDPDAELQRLQRQLSPLAEDLLKADARDFLAPFWRRLGGALAGWSFDPGRPQLHASLVAERLGDWQGVVDAVSAESDWRDQPVLLRREARAQGQLGRPWKALSSWALLCWRFPDRTEAIGREAGAEWHRRWRELGDLEPELSAGDFPAWLLLHYPGLAERLDPEVLSHAPPVFSLVGELLAESAGPRAMVLRRSLKQAHPALFEHYLRSLGG